MDEGTELAIARRGDDPIVMRLIHERDELRAEVERLKRLYDDVYAENQRLNQALDMLAEEREAWETDNERLRAALEKHHDLLSDEPGDCCQTCDLDYLGRPKE